MMDDDLYLPDGVEEPHYTQFPNLFLDWVMPKVSNAEWKVLCYLCRLTWGYHRYDEPTPIALGQIKRGTGLSHGAVVNALRIFRERGFIEVEPHASREHGTEANTYRLRVHKGTAAKNSGAGPLSEHGGVASPNAPPSRSGQPSSLYIKKGMKERAPSIANENKPALQDGENIAVPSSSNTNIMTEKRPHPARRTQSAPTAEEARAANARWGFCTQCGCKPCAC